MPVLQCDGSYRQGVWWVRVLGRGPHLKAPWNHAMFSERYGFRRFVPLGFGWRIGWLRRARAAGIEVREVARG